MMPVLNRWFADRRGQDLVEYALLGASLALAGFLVMSTFDDVINAVYTSWDTGDPGDLGAGGSAMTITASSIPSAVIAISLVACVFDIRTRRIPNALTFGARWPGLVQHPALDGTAGAQTAAGGWLVGLFLLLPFFALGGMGGGDVKLLAALGAWLGPSETFWLAMYSGMAGGVLGVIVALSQRLSGTRARERLDDVRATGARSGIQPVPNFTLDSSDAATTGVRDSRFSWERW